MPGGNWQSCEIKLAKGSHETSKVKRKLPFLVIKGHLMLRCSVHMCAEASLIFELSACDNESAACCALAPINAANVDIVIDLHVSLSLKILKNTNTASFYATFIQRCIHKFQFWGFEFSSASYNLSTSWSDCSIIFSSFSSESPRKLTADWIKASRFELIFSCYSVL